MQFNSLTFIIFAILFFAGWPLMRRHNNVRWIYLVAASFIFYGWWDWRFLFLIMGSGFIDFFAGLAMEKYPLRKKAWLIFSLIGNIGSLGIFKYINFGIDNANWILQLFGQQAQMPAANIILPVGISFYTFQSMSYTIDIYRNELEPTHNVFHFFAYLALFPQLVAGPIVRARELLPQLKSAEPVGENQRWEGSKLIAFGFFKKVVVADMLAVAVNDAFGAGTLQASSAYWWVIMIMFAFQIYCDFSGYSDIARGLGRWMGYEFPENFRNPYIASSFREFWQRWHISLSTWFRDYVYIALGGSKQGRVRSHINMWITMLISGLWHGAAWHFIIWSAAHSFYLSIERITNWPARLMKLPFGRHLATLAVFLLSTLAWVFFRAENLTQALSVFGILFNLAEWNGHVVHDLIDNNAINVLLVIIASQLFFYFDMDKADWSVSVSKTKKAVDVVLLALLYAIIIFNRAPSNTFIYFQF
ncbi:MAG: MBOAT family O-acyltransferase [Phycisphaerae bacterium]|jgi:D-alanyl-lipoteichoic acid acyltransferase DltB (MBOAT superfamily)